jgi:hypothetical protein
MVFHVWGTVCFVCSEYGFLGRESMNSLVQEALDVIERSVWDDFSDLYEYFAGLDSEGKIDFLENVGKSSLMADLEDHDDPNLKDCIQWEIDTVQAAIDHLKVASVGCDQLTLLEV